MSSSGGPKNKNKDDFPYVSSDGRLMRTRKEAIEANLGFEEGSDTGAGCAQDPENIVEPDPEEEEEPEEEESEDEESEDE